MNKIRQFAKGRQFPILVILICALVLGLFIFTDFGASWDEPDYYRYANSIIHAYSIKDRLSGAFRLESTLGPSDLRFYGPAFLIVGKGVYALLALIYPYALSYDIWHLIIYLTFLAGIFFFYQLALRMVKSPAAIVSTLLFASQPVIFGSAWINPKDIPLMAFFIGAIYLGLVFYDLAIQAFDGCKESAKDESTSMELQKGIRTKGQKIAFILSLFLCMISLFLLLGGDMIRQWIENTIISIDVNAPANLVDHLFVRIAENVNCLPRAVYARKAIRLFNQITGWFLAVAILWLLGTICLISDRRFFVKKFDSSKRLMVEMYREYRGFPHKTGLIFSFLGACLLLGFTCATRLAGGFAAVLVISIWVARLRKKSVPLIIAYGLISFSIFFIFWPYLWQNTWVSLLDAIHRMANFPDPHAVMFGGVMWDSRTLPASYLPSLLLRTLSEPTILLFLAGLALGMYQITKRLTNRYMAWLAMAWFLLPFFYVIITTPPLYDNYRHFLFILPGAFLICALAVDDLFTHIPKTWLKALIAVIILLPGFWADVQLHPYEYAYYNVASGGIKGAAHHYEVDYWLTCYKELTQQLNVNEKEPVQVYSFLSSELVDIYAKPNLKVTMGREGDTFLAGSLVALPLRWNKLELFPEYPIKYSIRLDGVDLCVAKQLQ